MTQFCKDISFSTITYTHLVQTQNPNGFVFIMKKGGEIDQLILKFICKTHIYEYVGIFSIIVIMRDNESS